MPPPSPPKGFSDQSTELNFRKPIDLIVSVNYLIGTKNLIGTCIDRSDEEQVELGERRAEV